MEEQTIEYFINNDPTFIEEDRKGGGKVFYWQYQVSNNIELPEYTAKRYAIGNTYNFAAPNTKPSKYAKEIGWDWNNGFSIGKEPQKLKDLIWEFQKSKIKYIFYSSPPSIPGKSYKNQNYPKGGKLKSLYNQDPISYTFKGTVIDSSTQESLGDVKIKDLENQKTTSNPDGSFEITGTFSPGKIQKLIFNSKKYGVKTLVITTLNGSIRSDINVIELTPNTKFSNSSIIKSQANTEAENKEIVDLGKVAEEFIPLMVNKAKNSIKTRLLPFIIKKLLCEPYGICDPLGLIEMAKEAKDKAKGLDERRKEKKEQKEQEEIDTGKIT